LVVPRLLGHDSQGEIVTAKQDLLFAIHENDFSDLGNTTTRRIDNIAMTQSVVYLLATKDKISVSENGTASFFHDFSFQEEFKRLKVVAHGDLKCSEEIAYAKMILEPLIIHSVLYNLVKNALEHSSTKKAELVVKSEKDLQNIIYSPEGSSVYSEFIGFHIHDNGKGFPSGKNLREYFTKVPEIEGRGLGLYFVGLAAKVLRGQIGITSEPGNTIVSFYNPVYIDLGKK
jgi:signal transduction histidine kinase